MNTPSRTTRVTLSSEPRCALAAASALKAAVYAASAQPRHRVLSQVGQDISACGLQPEASRSEKQVARLDVSTYEPNGVGGAGS